MFRKKVVPIAEVLAQAMRDAGLETPLKQKRIIDSWEEVAGPMASRYTTEKYIRNQTLFVRIMNPSLKANLMMRRTEILNILNAKVGAYIISEIRFC